MKGNQKIMKQLRNIFVLNKHNMVRFQFLCQITYLYILMKQKGEQKINYNPMKKVSLLVVLVFALGIVLSSCSRKTCPAYSQTDQEQSENYDG